jgi:topoisomerase-4 subunit B
LSQGDAVHYARDDAHKDALMKDTLTGRGKIEISRFKGLGEMMPAQLRETTMDPRKRALLRVRIAGNDDQPAAKDIKETETMFESLMGRKPELRFQFIQENAKFVRNVDV